MIKIFFRQLVIAFFDLIYYLILIRIIFSFFPMGPYTNPTLRKIVQFFYQITEPILSPFRQLVSPFHMGSGAYLDLSPLFALLVLWALRRLLLSTFFLY